MKFEDDKANSVTRFDDVAGYRPDEGGEPLSLAQVRAAAGLLEHVVTPVQARAASYRVQRRLFPMPPGSVRAPASPDFVPGWLRVAAAIAVLVTGLAVFRGVPHDMAYDHDSAISVAAPEEPPLLFPGEAVIDSRLARLGTEVATLTDESIWASNGF